MTVAPASSQRSWVPGTESHCDFPIENLPLGVFSQEAGRKRIGIAIGDFVLDLHGVQSAGMIDEPDLAQDTLNAVLSWQVSRRQRFRSRVAALLCEDDERSRVEHLLIPRAECEMHMPVLVGDYTDFYAGIHHARNVGALFRPDNALLPNYKYVPIGYHGRASSICRSGENVVRPQGQILQDGKQPILALTKKLDFELELGIWIGPGNALGYPIPIREAANHIAGFCLLNDWSARDLQAWEYQPLGPFLSKSFQTTISPWIVSPEALTAHRAPAMIRPEGDPRPLPYLWDDEDQSSGSYRIRFHVSLSSEKMRNARMAPLQLAEVEASDLYWTVAQLVTHHTVNGCSLRAGDLIGTGTISSDTMHNVGSLLEFTANGQRTFTLPTGEKRAFLVDGDEIAIRARAAGTDKPSIGFGECTARVVSAPVG